MRGFASHAASHSGFALLPMRVSSGPDVAAHQVTRRILDGVAGGAERFAIQAWSRGWIGSCRRLEPQRAAVSPACGVLLLTR